MMYVHMGKYVNTQIVQKSTYDFWCVPQSVAWYNNRLVVKALYWSHLCTFRLHGSIGCWWVPVHGVTCEASAVTTRIAQLVMCEDSWSSSLSYKLLVSLFMSVVGFTLNR